MHLALVPCAAMARARLLLPLLAAAEEDLQRKMSSGPEGCVDIEHVGEDEPHIEMVGRLVVDA